MGGSKLVPITREVLREFYKGYPLDPVPEVETDAHTEALKRVQTLVGRPGNKIAEQVALETPSRIDDNFWRTRMHCEEAAFYLAKVCKDDKAMPAQCRTTLEQLQAHLLEGDKAVQAMQNSNTEAAAAHVKRFLPQDFRSAFIERQRQVTEAKNKKAVDDLAKKGASIRTRYDLYLKQQWERREALVQMGNLSGTFKLIVKYIGGVPQVLLDFAKEINAKLGPMEEQRVKYGPDLYRICGLGNELVVTCAMWADNATGQPASNTEEATAVVAAAAEFFVSHLTRVVNFLGVLFTKSPFFITADDAQAAHEAEVSRISTMGPPGSQVLEPHGARRKAGSKTGGVPGRPHAGDEEDDRLSNRSEMGALQPHCGDALLAAVGIHPHGSSPSGSGSTFFSAVGSRNLNRPNSDMDHPTHGLRTVRSSFKRHSSQSAVPPSPTAAFIRTSAPHAGGAPQSDLLVAVGASATSHLASGGARNAHSMDHSSVPMLPSPSRAAAAAAAAGMLHSTNSSGGPADGGASAKTDSVGQVQVDMSGQGPQHLVTHLPGSHASGGAAQGGAGRSDAATPFLSVSRIPLEDGGAAAGPGAHVGTVLTLLPSAEFISCVDNMSWVSNMQYQASLLDPNERTSWHLADLTSPTAPPPALASAHGSAAVPPLLTIQSADGDLSQLEVKQQSKAQQQQQQDRVVGGKSSGTASAAKVDVVAGGQGAGAKAGGAARREGGSRLHWCTCFSPPG